MLPDGNGMEFASRIRKERGAFLIYLTAMDQEMDILSGYDGGADDYITKPFSLLILLSKVNAFMRRYQEREEGGYVSDGIEVDLREDGGADDYITKPFSLLILLSKVNAFMRRYQEREEGGYVSDGIEVDLREMKVTRHEEQVALSKKEMQILILLLENGGHILSKEQILEQVWDVALSKKEMQILILLLENGGHILSKEQILEQVWDKDGQFVDDNTVTVNISRLKNKLETDAISNVRGIGYLWTEPVKRK